MTRTWFALPDELVFAVAGIWRDTDEWGPAYSMVMTEACIHVVDVHDRMPVILRREEWTDWLDDPPDAAGLLCGPIPSLWSFGGQQTHGGLRGLRPRYQSSVAALSHMMRNNWQNQTGKTANGATIADRGGELTWL